jgi:hypothetical protein
VGHQPSHLALPQKPLDARLFLGNKHILFQRRDELIVAKFPAAIMTFRRRGEPPKDKQLLGRDERLAEGRVVVAGLEADARRLKDHLTQILGFELAGSDFGSLPPLLGADRFRPPTSANRDDQRQPEQFTNGKAIHAWTYDFGGELGVR